MTNAERLGKYSSGVLVVQIWTIFR